MVKVSGLFPLTILRPGAILLLQLYWGLSRRGMMEDFKMRLIGLIVGLLFCCAGSASLGAVWIEFVDMGVPTDGVQLMHGWRGVTVRIQSDGAPITRLNFNPGGITGSIAHRWTDPTGQGNLDPHFYGITLEQRSLGPLTANNSTLSEFNFDSHFLGEVDDFQSIDFADEVNLNGFHLAPTHLTSTPFVGYGSPFPYTPAPDIDPFQLSRGRMYGNFTLTAAAQSPTIDLAYVVTDSSFMVAGQVYTADSTIPTPFQTRYFIPEPSFVGFAFFGAVGLIRRKR